ncbi:hypothetical protein KP509_24G005700 [Ceratopteris richardii]|nr:hypothetical protein KP509_24G005700 [Ceratopteris richardii]
MWLQKGIKNGNSKAKNTGTPTDWSKYKRNKHDWTTATLNSSWHDFQKYLTWLHKDSHMSRRKFFLKREEKFKYRSDSVSSADVYEPLPVSSVDLQAGEELLVIPLHYCITDKVPTDDIWSLSEAPWEIRLALRLLQERSKSDGSMWYPYLKLLSSIRLPLFFSESELQNVEDVFITKEIQAIRAFAESSFQALNQHKFNGYSFADFVWALGVVYLYACRVDLKGESGLSFSGSTYLLVPFMSHYSSLSAKASIKLQGDRLKLVMVQDAEKGSSISFDCTAKTSVENFLFRGFIPTKCPHDKARLFENLEDLVKWWMSAFEENGSKVPMKMIYSGLRSLYDQFYIDSPQGALASVPDFSVGLDGYIDPYMISALGYLAKTEGMLQDDTQFFDVNNEYYCTLAGSMLYNKTLTSRRFMNSICRDMSSHMVEGWNRLPLYTRLALSKRILGILNSLSATVEEDEALLEASMWEGLSDDDDGSHLCETCQWQTEELSFNDFLTLKLHIQRKNVLLQALSVISYDCVSKEVKEMKESGVDNSSDDTLTDSHKEFLKWCEEGGAHITEALTLTNIFETSNITDSTSVVRGVKAVRDIEQGEIICVLPLKLGLVDTSSSHLAGADSWHLAAAHLLREKSLGGKTNWASYINILPKTVQSPFYLLPQELDEVQWWPVLRELVQIRRAIRTSFSLLSGEELGWADFDHYRWAVAMVHSRAFTLPVGKNDDYASYVLMPFMDMINHHFEYQADWMSMPVRDGKLEIVAKKRIRKGEQIFASFGPRSNDNLFLYYGFILEDNPFDSAHLFSSFQDAVNWMANIWGTGCNQSDELEAKEECEHNVREGLWIEAHKAIDDYAAGVTDQRPEWWKLINTWADYGYEYMQFQPSPSIYARGITDPTLYVALEAVIKALIAERNATLEGCRHNSDNEVNHKSNLRHFFLCLNDITWKSAAWALHSSICSEYACQVLTSLSKRDQISVMVKMSTSLRCIEILNSFPTTILEDQRLLKQHRHASIHVQLARQYRFLKKKFLMDYIHHVSENLRIGT